MARTQEKAHTLMNKWVTSVHRMRMGQTAYSLIVWFILGTDPFLHMSARQLQNACTGEMMSLRRFRKRSVKLIIVCLF